MPDILKVLIFVVLLAVAYLAYKKFGPASSKPDAAITSAPVPKETGTGDPTNAL